MPLQLQGHKMTGIRITTRTNLKLDISNIYECINNNKPGKALKRLDSAEKNIVVYYNTRGLDCENFFPHFAQIRNLLHRFRNSTLYKKKLYGYLLNLNKEMRTASYSEDGKTVESKNPVEVLKHLSDDLIDDYSEFDFSGGREVIEKNREVLELIRNDLLEMRELEPLFKTRPEKEQDVFNTLLKNINLCLMILPQANDVSIAPNTAKTLRGYFEALFNTLSDISMPVQHQIGESVELRREEPLSTEENKKEIDVEGKKEEKEEIFNEKKSLNKMAGDLGMDIQEMERKVKEGLIRKKEEDTNDQEQDGL